jgi:hypothetical protein
MPLSKLSSKITCPICGQAFRIYAEPGVSVIDTMSRRVIEHALRTHHTPRATSSSAHPGSAFRIRNLCGAEPFLASVSLSGVHSVAR